MNNLSIDLDLLGELTKSVRETKTNLLALTDEVCGSRKDVKGNCSVRNSKVDANDNNVKKKISESIVNIQTERDRQVQSAYSQGYTAEYLHITKLHENKILVDKDAMSTLATEVSQMRENLPRVLNREVFDRITMLCEMQSTCEEKQSNMERLELEGNHWKSRCENALVDLQKEKEESLKLRCEVQELTQQLAQQTEYCSSMGSTCCTLLWRVSRCEESIESLVMGTKINEFFSITGSTIESYLEAYCEDIPEEKTDESQFVLALCGIVTNMAASAIGREELIKNEYGRGLVDTLLNSLSLSNNKKGVSKMKNLFLMALFNLSINQKGLKYIATKSGIMGVLSWLLREETNVEIKLNSLRLIQSLICDENNLKALHELQENLTLEDLHTLSRDNNKDVRELSLELVMDIETLKSEN